MLAEKANSNDNSFFKKILLGGTEKSKKNIARVLEFFSKNDK